MIICGNSVSPDSTVAFHATGGGSNPTFPLQFEKADWWVESIPLTTAQELVEKYHYARGGSNTRVFTHGLFYKPTHTLAGVAWWLPPTKSAAMANFDGDWQQVLALSRLVIVPGVPTNAASFLISKSVLLVKQDERWKCLITYADEWRGHTGKIYLAAGWDCTGKTKPFPTYVDNAGVLKARKAGPKTRTHQQMLDAGCKRLGNFAKHRFRKLL